jgi:hypothetical protein
MQKKIFSVLFIIVLFIIIQSIFISHDKLYKVSEINSPISFIIGNKEFLFKDIETFDSKYTQRNKELSINLGITEEEAFVLGNLAKQWAISLMKGRNVYIKNQDLIYFKTSYRQKFLFSGYCLLNSKPYYNEMFNKKLALVRKGNYKVLEFRDYQEEKVINMNTKEVSKTDLPKSNVLYYALENDAWCCARPSGTEPKIKFYLGVKEENMEKAQEVLKALAEDVKKYIK